MAGGNVAAESRHHPRSSAPQNESLIHTYVGKLLFHNNICHRREPPWTRYPVSLPRGAGLPSCRGGLTFIAEKPMVYIRGMNQYVQRCIFAGEFNEEQRKSTCRLRRHHHQSRAYALRSSTNRGLYREDQYGNSLLSQLRKVDHGGARLADWQHGLDRHRKNMHLQVIDLCVLISACYWLFNGQWTQALVMVSPHPTAGRPNDIRRDIVSAAKLPRNGHSLRAWECFLLVSVRSMYPTSPNERLGNRTLSRFLRESFQVEISPRELRRYFMQLHHQLHNSSNLQRTYNTDLF